MLRTRVLTLAVVAAACVLSSSPLAGATRASASAAPKPCGTYTSHTRYGSSVVSFTHADIFVTGISCLAARTVLKELSQYPTPRSAARWHATFNTRSLGGRYPFRATYRNGSRVITYRFTCGGC